jgi:hypothetical protein
MSTHHLQRTRLERIAKRKLRQHQLTQDGNVEFSGRDLPEHIGLQHRLFER